MPISDTLPQDIHHRIVSKALVRAPEGFAGHDCSLEPGSSFGYEISTPLSMCIFFQVERMMGAK